MRPLRAWLVLLAIAVEPALTAFPVVAQDVAPRGC